MFSMMREKLLHTSSSSTKKGLRYLIISSVTVCFLLFTFHLSRRYEIFAPREPLLHRTCAVDVSVLEQFRLSETVHYVRREVIASETPSITSDMAHLEAPLLDTYGFNVSQKTTDSMIMGKCYEPITLEVPVPPAPADASHLDFGIATTAGRLYDALDAFAHWAGGSGARVFAIVEPGEDLSDVKGKASDLKISLKILESTEEYNTRYFALVKFLADSAREETQWSCIMDDDTFFPSMPRLVELLGQYDEKQPYYIGGLSESDKQISIFGIMAYGGAGIFLSRPLLNQLRDVFDECQAMEGNGDGKIAYCIYQHTTTKLTAESRLRQLDLNGDASGFFEAGRPVPVSLHHWRSWFDADMVKISAVSQVCGPSCMFRQWRFSDGWILTNGYSVIRYSQTLPEGDLSMEKTWTDINGATDWSYLHSLGPLRPKDAKKLSYRLEGVTVENQDDDQQRVVRQYYIHRGGGSTDSLSPGTTDSVLELVWRRGEKEEPPPEQ
jgi:hypothetical protein